MVFGAPWRDFKHSSAIENAENWRQRRFEKVQMEGTRDPRRGGSGTTR